MVTKSEISLSNEQKSMIDNALKQTKPVEYIETGNVGLDLALTDGKGLPMGSSTLFWAKPGSGKTTIVADASRRLIQAAKNRGEVFKVLYLGVEDSKELMYSLGMGEYMESGDFLYVGQSLCWRQIETFYEAAIKGYGKCEGVRLIIIDSINNVLSDQNMKNSIADGDYGTKARERSSFYSKFLPLCKEHGISSFFISQVRKRQNAGPYEDQNRAAVSDVDLHNVDIILKCSSFSDKTDASKIEEETAFGKDKVASKCIFKMDSKAADCKNRYFKGNAVELLFEKGKCVWNYYTIKKLLTGNKLIKGTGGWYTFDPDICASFNIPENKLRNTEINNIVQEHAGDFVELLKKMGKYKVGIKETEVPVTDEDLAKENEEE
jgi:RecA/RadA recombinase